MLMPAFASAALFAGFLLAAGVAYLRARAFLATAISVDAKVVALIPYTVGTTTRHLSRIQFRLEDDVVEADLPRDLWYAVGTPLVILYAPGDPTTHTCET